MALSSNRYPDFAVNASPSPAAAAHLTDRRGATAARCRDGRRGWRDELEREGKDERESILVSVQYSAHKFNSLVSIWSVRDVGTERLVRWELVLEVREHVCSVFS